MQEEYKKVTTEVKREVWKALKMIALQRDSKLFLVAKDILENCKQVKAILGKDVRTVIEDEKG